MTLAKLENGRLVICPKSGISGGYHHTNLPKYYADHPEDAKKDGWMELRKTQRPDEPVSLSHKIENGQIVEQWTPVTPEPDVYASLPERLELLEECILEMSEKLYA